MKKCFARYGRTLVFEINYSSSTKELIVVFLGCSYDTINVFGIKTDSHRYDVTLETLEIVVNEKSAYIHVFLYDS